jgi:HPt (histidine-containing phosphotransfer) domain-containing protein
MLWKLAFLGGKDVTVPSQDTKPPTFDHDMSAASVFQAQTMETLRHQLGDDRRGLLREIVGQYLDQSRDLVAQMEAENTAVDPARLRALAHKLRGSTATMGGDRLAAVCHRIEHLPPAELDFRHATQKVRREYAMLADELDRYLSLLCEPRRVE